MDELTVDPRTVDVDEVWLREWSSAGMEQIDAYLAKHAAFAAFLAERGPPDEHDTS